MYSVLGSSCSVIQYIHSFSRTPTGAARNKPELSVLVYPVAEELLFPKHHSQVYGSGSLCMQTERSGLLRGAAEGIHERAVPVHYPTA